MSTRIPGFCVGCASRQANSSGKVGGQGHPGQGCQRGEPSPCGPYEALRVPLQVGSGCTEPRGQQGNLETGGFPGRVTLDSPRAAGGHTRAHTQARFLPVQFSRSVVSDSCDPVDCSTPGLPVHHQLPKRTQTHVHRVNDAIQPSHPLSSICPPALNLSQHQGLFQ